MPIACSAIASSPEVTCSPAATTASYSRASCIGEASRHHCDVMPRVDFAFVMPRDVADSVDIGDGRTAEFHHEAAHDDACIPCEDKYGCPNGNWSARVESGVYIAARPGASDRGRFRPKMA